MTMDWAAIFDGFLVFSFGALVGGGELISRYRDEPWGVIISPPGLFYMLLNALVSVTALIFVRGFGWTFNVQADSVRWTQLLVSGFGAMSFFRSSLFTVRVDNEDIPVGPNSFLQIILAAADREVDRRRATVRASEIKEIMTGVAFEEAKEALPVSCIALMQNMPRAEQAELNRDVSRLSEAEMLDSEVKSYLLGAALLTFFGDEVLEAAVALLEEHIRPPFDDQEDNQASSQ